ncbi:MAG: LytTR family DNA-binding domain-containing protein [Bacteroidales bacterium]|nr:LytTR family DNA-binding domain-containing protein [Bacteroidales bacterium]
MKAFIIEDEPLARRTLARMLEKYFPDVEIVGEAGSVSSSTEWLRSHTADIIFMDVELSDGKCFEIFRRIKVNSFVVMTTAYDSFAVKAFEENAVDYLLKPVELPALERAVQRCREDVRNTNINRLIEAVSQGPRYKERFMVRIGERIVPVAASGIAYVLSEDKATFFVLQEGEKYIYGASLDELEMQLDPRQFFRVSRGCIISRSSIQSILRLGGSRLRIIPVPAPREEITVARSRYEAFLSWLES